MTKKKSPMQNFILRLRKLDNKLSKEIKKITPYWWDDSLSDSAGSSQQAILSIAKSLNLDIKSVLDTNAELKFKEVLCCYKKAENKAINDLSVATGLVYSASKAIEKAVINDFKALPDSSVIREQILEAGHKWVDLESLVRYCWDYGVAVLFLPKLPASKKMDAVVQRVNGRPIITITKNQKHESQLLFLLAHEMGHIFHNHLEGGQAIIDESVNSHDEVDQQEMEANSFALSLLTGSDNARFHSGGRRISGLTLAQNALSFANANHIDPGHIALNWAHNTQQWPISSNALNLLYPEPSWKKTLNDMLLKNIEQFEVDEEQLDYLFNLIGIEV